MEKKYMERMWPPEIPYDYNGMSVEIAMKAIAGASRKSEEMGFTMTTSVCDAAGNLTAVVRMDDAPLLSIEIAQNKAKTAVYGKMPTFLWGDSFKGTTPELSPLHFHSNWITFMGGFPDYHGWKIDWRHRMFRGNLGRWAYCKGRFTGCRR